MAQPTTTASQPDPSTSEILPAVLRILRDGRCGPAAWLRMLRFVIEAGRRATVDLSLLRHSFRRWVLFHAVIAVAVAVLLLLWLPPTPALVAIGVQLAYGYLVVRVVGAQLALVRTPGGQLLQRFGLANALTFYRVLFVPYVGATVVLLGTHPQIWLLTLVLYGTAAASDLLDGMVARGFDERTDFGRIYDPVGDILFNPAVALALVPSGGAPWWYALILVFRYWGLLLAAFLYYVLREPYPIEPTWAGKISGFAAALVLGFAVLELAVSPAWLGPQVLLVLFIVSGSLTGFNVAFLTVRGFQLLLAPRRGG